MNDNVSHLQNNHRCFRLSKGRVYVLLACLLGGFHLRPAHGREADKDFEEQQFLFMLEEAYTQEVQEWQVGSSLAYFDHQVSIEGSERKVKDLWSWETEIEYGLQEGLQIELEIPFQDLSTREDGETTRNHDVSDIELGVGVRLLEEEIDSLWFPTLTLSVGAVLPTGDWREGLGSDHLGWETQLAASKVIGDFVVHVLGGVGFTDDAKEWEDDETKTLDKTEWEWGTALVYRPNESLNLLCELMAEFETEDSVEGKNHETELYLTPGLRYACLDNLEVGAGLAVGLNDESYDWGLIFQFLFEWD